MPIVVTSQDLRLLVKHALDTLEGSGLVVVQVKYEGLRQNGTQIIRHDHMRDRSQAERFIRVHQLLFIACREFGFFLREPRWFMVLGVSSQSLISSLYTNSTPGGPMTATLAVGSPMTRSAPV